MYSIRPITFITFYTRLSEYIMYGACAFNLCFCIAIICGVCVCIHVCVCVCMCVCVCVCVHPCVCIIIMRCVLK